ncbi:hypothetical protein Efla_004883 [Eimeria flavescens]
MSSSGSPRLLRDGPHDISEGQMSGAQSTSPGGSSVRSVYVHIPAPHWRLKPQTAEEAQRKQQAPPKTWLNVVSNSLLSLVYTSAIVAVLLLSKSCSWNWHGEPQFPLLSVPLHTSWQQLLTPAIDCAKEPPFVALAAMTSAADYEGRQTVRQTWGARKEVEGRRIFLFFVLGTVTSDKVQKAVEAEALQFGDLLQHSAPDKYSNLALKTATIIQWVAASCSQAKFLLKADTDTLVNLDRMVPYLKRMEDQHDLALGVRIDNMPLVLNPKSRNYQDPLVYSRSVFPPYLSGACYILSGDLIQKLVHVLPEVPRPRNEDTFLGMCLERVGIEPRNIGAEAPINPWFDPSRGPCAAFRLAAAHALKRDLMLAMWSWWHSGGSKMCH